MKPKVLFLCTGYAPAIPVEARWRGGARHLLDDRIEPYSAGIDVHGINANAVRVMREAGIDVSGQSSKLVSTLADVPLDLVITVCGHADENCPVFLSKACVVHVGFDDPPRLAKSAANEAEALSHYRRVRDKIRDFLTREFVQLLSTATK